MDLTIAPIKKNHPHYDLQVKCSVRSRIFPMKQSHYPRHSGILSHGSHTMPNTPGTWQQQAGECTAEERGLLGAISLQRVPNVALLSGALSLRSSIADCSSSGRSTNHLQPEAYLRGELQGLRPGKPTVSILV